MYSVLDDIKKLLPAVLLLQLTDDENTGTINTPRVNEAIAQADAEIDLSWGMIYQVPFVIVPPIIKKHSVDIAIYNLYSRRVEEIPQTRDDRYRNAKKELGDIASGALSLSAVSGASDVSTEVLETSHF